MTKKTRSKSPASSSQVSRRATTEMGTSTAARKPPASSSPVSGRGDFSNGKSAYVSDRRGRDAGKSEDVTDDVLILEFEPSSPLAEPWLVDLKNLFSALDSTFTHLQAMAPSNNKEFFGYGRVEVVSVE